MRDKSGLLEYSTSQKRNLYNWQNKDIMRGIQKAEPYWFKLNFCVENFLLTLAATQLSWYCNNLCHLCHFSSVAYSVWLQEQYVWSVPVQKLLPCSILRTTETFKTPVWTDNVYIINFSAGTSATD